MNTPDKICSSCSGSNPHAVRFCGMCGAAFPTEAPNPELARPAILLAPATKPKKPIGFVSTSFIGALLLFMAFYTIACVAMIFASETRAGGFTMLFLEITIATGVLAAMTKGVFRKRYTTTAISALVCMFIAASFAPHTDASQSAAAATAAPTDAPVVADATDAPTETPEPTEKPETYEEQRKREKREFLGGIDPTVTADKIAGNPMKYVDSNVDLHCTVSNVPQDGIVNAACGDNGTNIVLEYDEANTLDQGQAIRVLGTVDNPQQGTNSFGGAMNFPTIQVKFME